ncbi:MAG: hypothetical protein M3R38_08565 [Actinomycetota bacterium]|nr:hypothetical protein [Actinomycetota bacterium]
MRNVRTWKWMLLVGFGAFFGYGAWAFVQLPDQPGSGQGGAPAVYGAPAPGAAEPLRIEEAVSRAKGSPDPTVTLRGEVVDMGPTMGCWLLVNDGTGEVLIQTDPMVYMPQELRGATMEATGSLVYGRFGGMGYEREGWFLLSPGAEVVERSSEGRGA